jgi:hypothetical protein
MITESKGYAKFFSTGLTALQTDRCEWTGWESGQVCVCVCVGGGV